MELHPNWIAVALAVVAQMAVGYVWFMPAVMGKRYAEALGQNYETMRPANPALTYGLTALFTVFFTLWLMVNVTGPGQEDVRFHTFQHGIGHAVLLTLLVFTPVLGTLAIHEKRGWTWFLVHAGHWFLRMAVAGGILSLMR